MAFSHGPAQSARIRIEEIMEAVRIGQGRDDGGEGFVLGFEAA